MMEMAHVKDITRHNPLTIGIPAKQSIVLVSRDSSTDSSSKIEFCPTYHFCRKFKKPYRVSMFDGDHSQQITTLHNLLQAIKESAIRLIQLIINDIEERWKRGPDFQMCYPESRRYKKSDQQRNESKLILATTPSSVCALCGVALRLKNSSEKLEQFVFDTQEKEYHNRHCNIMKTLNNAFVNMTPYKTILSVEKEKRQQEIISETQLIDANESGLKSKLLFVRRISSEKTTCQICRAKSQQKHDINQAVNTSIMSVRCQNQQNLTQQTSRTTYASLTISSTQDASTLTHEIYCPCACGLLVKDETKSEVSIISLPDMLKENLIKNNFEELNFYLNSNQTMYTKTYDNTQKLKKDVNIERWREDIKQLQLQAQVDELQRNIQFFKHENKYIRYLIEKCRCSLKINFCQELPIFTVIYSELTSAIKRLQTKYYNKNGIITTITKIFRGSINIQQIAGKLLTPFIEHKHRNSNSTLATNVSSTVRDENSFEVVESHGTQYLLDNFK